MTHDHSALQQLLADMSEADALYRPTQFWRNALEPLIAEMSGEGLARFRAMDGPLSYFVPTYGFPGYNADRAKFDTVRRALEQVDVGDKRCASHLERAMSGEAQAESDYRVLLAADVETAPFLSRFSESTVGEPVEHFSFEGRRFSRSALNYLLGLAFLKRHCDASSIRTVLEIGAGFGSLGEILLGDRRNDCFYVDVDIPPTIHAATYYLSQVFGESAVFRYATSRAMSTIDLAAVRGSHRAAMFATWQLPKLVGTVDLFVNFISFQEMEPEVVQNYLAHVDRLQARYVLLRNLREGKAKAKSAEDVGAVRDPIVGEAYDGFLTRYRLVATNTVPFGYLTVDGFHSELRLYERL